MALQAVHDAIMKASALIVHFAEQRGMGGSDGKGLSPTPLHSEYESRRLPL